MDRWMAFGEVYENWLLLHWLDFNDSKGHKDFSINLSISGVAFYSAFGSIFHAPWPLVWLLYHDSKGISWVAGWHSQLIITSQNVSLFLLPCSLSISPLCLWLCLSFCGLVHIKANAKLHILFKIFFCAFSFHYRLRLLFLFNPSSIASSMVISVKFFFHAPFSSTLLSPCVTATRFQFCSTTQNYAITYLS